MAQKVVQMDIYDGQMLPWHQKVVEDPHRFKTIVAGRKARKTTLMVNELMFHALTDPRGLTYLYLAPWRKQAKEIAWDDHVNHVLRLCNQFGIKYKINMSELTIKFEGGSKFQISGADNAEALRGKSDWGGVGLDEYGTGDVWKPYVWDEIIRPNLQVHKAWAYIGGTPKGYGNDFYRKAKLGDHEGVIDDSQFAHDKDFMTFHATSYDNKFTDPEEIESAKRTTTVDFFNQEYLALFTRFTGLVYPEFNVNEHVHLIEHEFNQHGDYYFGLDFAVRGFTAAVVAWVRTNGHVYILPKGEYKQEALTAKENAENIKNIILNHADLGKYVGYADPSGFAKNQQGLKVNKSGVMQEMVWSLADEYLEEDLPIIKGNNEVTAGIDYVRKLFKAGKIHIDPSNPGLIEELLQYQWKEQPDTQRDVQEQPEKVRKFNDHLVDALRYMLYSKPTPPDELEEGRPMFPAKFELKITPESDNRDVFTELSFPSVFD